jgi:triacylglycerol lipase
LARLLAWLRAKARSLGGDPARIVFWGHSAGAAHVADFLAREPAAPLAGAILTSGIYSLGPELSPWKDYYGSDPALYPERQSLLRLAAVPVPLLVNHAELDPPAFVADTLALLRARAVTGQPTRQLRLPSHSHISETYAIGTHDRSLSAPVLEFIQALPANRSRR